MKKLTKEEAITSVNEIEGLLDADGYAHELEDALYLRFVECLAAGLYDNLTEIIEVAKIVKSSKDVDFGRWFE
jgi:hypothetical protein